jgi:TRAP transporter TAXI family solute receptor
MGVWDKIERNAMGYNDAAAAFGNKQLDAFWLFTAFPSGAVIMAAQTNDIDMIDLAADAKASGFFDKYPYFSKLAVPAGTYRGVDKDIPSFQDSALWVANSKVPDDVVYKLLSLVYTDEGLAHMKEQKKTFKNMSLKTGTDGIVTPFHPGAIKFWKEKGMLK